MDLEKIEGLVKIIENSSLTEFTLKEGDLKITMSKLDHPPVVAAGAPMMTPPMQMPQAAAEGGVTGQTGPETPKNGPQSDAKTKQDQTLEEDKKDAR